MKRRILCDTCALIWLSTGDAKLSRAARSMIRDAQMLCFSSISIWEIARKVKRGELEIPVPPTQFAEMLVTHYGMKELPLDNAVVLRASALPDIHKDPVDRFIIATAFLNNCVIATGDRRFPEYGVETIG
ncbi:MAG: type II toxin-antitoxin system VapC family toxin [Kiritimatiellae bacterium]|nr:type II toxin-antitoxin system VapC family toxin [Kiritimatiellia bacterium]